MSLESFKSFQLLTYLSSSLLKQKNIKKLIFMHFLFYFNQYYKRFKQFFKGKTTVFSQTYSHFCIPLSQMQSFLPLQLIVQVSLSLNNILILLFLDFSIFRYYLLTSHYERRKFSFSSFPGFYHTLLLSPSFILLLIL